MFFSKWFEQILTLKVNQRKTIPLKTKFIKFARMKCICTTAIRQSDLILTEIVILIPPYARLRVKCNDVGKTIWEESGDSITHTLRKLHIQWNRFGFYDSFCLHWWWRWLETQRNVDNKYKWERWKLGYSEHISVTQTYN